MVAVQCKSCGKAYYPKRDCCPNCKSRDFAETKLGDECRLVTYTKLYAIPSGIEQIPLILGIVEFQNGVRALGQIMFEDVKIGMKLQPVWGLLRKLRGKEVYGFKFKPTA